MRKLLIIGIVFLLVTSLWADKTYETQGSNGKEYIEISMEQLFKTCEENLVSASLKYNGKTLLISKTKLDSIGFNPWYGNQYHDYNNYEYQLTYYEYPFSLIIYPLNSELTNIASLSAGDNNVTIQGECLISNNYEIVVINARIITDSSNTNFKNLYDLENVCSTEELKSEICINYNGSYATLGFPLEHLISEEFSNDLLEVNNSNDFLKNISINLLDDELVFERIVGNSNLSLTIKFIEDGALLSSATAPDFNIFNSNNEQDIATVFSLLFACDDDLYNVMLNYR